MRRRSILILAVGAVALLALALVAYVYFAPKPSTRVEQAAIAGEALFSGAFADGLPGHHVSGTVKLVRASDGSASLRFEDYEATAGPDVYFFLTPKARADTAADVEGAGVRLAVPGGSSDGQATLRGDFNVPLAASIDLDAYRGITVWCQRYDAFFGYAELA